MWPVINLIPRWLVEITAFRMERIFQLMRPLEFLKGHVVYNLAYD